MLFQQQQILVIKDLVSMAQTWINILFCWQQASKILNSQAQHLRYCLLLLF
jgi:hypothetical protein